MNRLICEECKKVYDYDVDDFCPRCGAFNRPKKTWGVDARGNVIRVDGVNEANHKGSFVHREIHKEKFNRRVTGLDQDSAVKRQKKAASRPAEKKGGSVIGTIIWLIVALNVLRGCLSMFL